MIAFRDDLPLIVLGDRRVMAFDSGWLTRALTVAARTAGYPNWWLAPHVAESVQSWLQTLNERTVMPVDHFTRARLRFLLLPGSNQLAKLRRFDRMIALVDPGHLVTSAAIA